MVNEANTKPVSRSDEPRLHKPTIRNGPKKTIDFLAYFQTIRDIVRNLIRNFPMFVIIIIIIYGIRIWLGDTFPEQLFMNIEAAMISSWIIISVVEQIIDDREKSRYVKLDESAARRIGTVIFTFRVHTLEKLDLLPTEDPKEVFNKSKVGPMMAALRVHDTNNKLILERYTTLCEEQTSYDELKKNVRIVYDWPEEKIIRYYYDYKKVLKSLIKNINEIFKHSPNRLSVELMSNIVEIRDVLESSLDEYPRDRPKAIKQFVLEVVDHDFNKIFEGIKNLDLNKVNMAKQHVSMIQHTAASFYKIEKRFANMDYTPIVRDDKKEVNKRKVTPSSSFHIVNRSDKTPVGRAEFG